LRRDLEARGHRFATRSDTETIVHGYEEHGLDVLDRLNGMFAFALWDRRLARLFLCRDRLGIKPLYYAEIPAGLAFASELKSLRAHPAVPDRLDVAAVRQYFAWEYIPSPRTPFEGVLKLPPAHRLVADRTRVEAATYWTLR